MSVENGSHWPDAAAFTTEWFQQRKRIRKRSRRAAGKTTMLVFPCDPDTLIGSKGDEAMLLAYLGKFDAPNAKCKVVALCRSEEAKSAARRLGFEPRSVWEEGWAIQDFARALNDVGPDHVTIMGADIMDGYYHPCVSAERYAFADLAIRANIATTILGFSFNAHPVPELADIIRHVDRSVKFPLRDPVSLERWRDFSGRPGELVADVAFLLAPADAVREDQEVDRWIDAQRALGRSILGFNIHQLLFEGKDDQENSIYDQLGDSLRHGIDHGISWILLPHDVRTADSDLACLRRLDHRLAASGHHFLVERELQAAQIKRLAGKLDGIISGRMHLAIAGLGMGTPVAAFGYVGKFEGLFEHFKIDAKYLGNLAGLANERNLSNFILDFSRDLSPSRHRVRSRLPDVTRLAAKNLEFECVPSRYQRIIRWLPLL